MTRFMITLCLSALLASGARSSDLGWTLFNPTGHDYRQELVRIKTPLPASTAAKPEWRVLRDGVEVPAQIELRPDGRAIWVAADLKAGERPLYRVIEGTPAAFEPLVRVSRDTNGSIVMDNGLLALRLPAKAQGSVPSPITQFRWQGGPWVGHGEWSTQRKLTSFKAVIEGSGPLFGKVRLSYAFEGTAGIDDAPAFAEVVITLPPGRRHAIVEESYNVDRSDHWELDLASGWAPRSAECQPHGGGFDRPTLNDPDGKPYRFPPASLAIGQTRMGDTLINLWPRWSQAYDDGWFFMAHDGAQAAGCIVARAGQWVWPHDNGIEVKVKPTADYAGLRCPTWRGSRYWLLVAGPREMWSADRRETYVIRHTLETLDKLHQEYILEWPGMPVPDPLPKGETAESWVYPDGRFATRASAFFGWNKGGFATNSRHPVTLLTQTQVYFDPDTYGNYWLHWSPENPNFATAWWRQCQWMPGKLVGHPQYTNFCRMAAQRFREDLYHSVTLPGGAGQECPGYLAHSMGLWRGLREHCQTYLGFDPAAWPRYTECASYQLHLSFPMGDGTRRVVPAGDTHPPGPPVDETASIYGLASNVREFTTEELPGFGVVFRNRSGADRETFLSFKSGPNRGHFHGDQLAFHYAPNGRPQVVDHHCSYGPRAGQEHMHNRVAFHTDALPYANMDGYERVIAFKTSPEADVAIGQVESERLRETRPQPPELWDCDRPQVQLDTPLIYRRTIVQLKQADRDVFVIRDQHVGPDVYATYCLHAYGDTCVATNGVIDFDGVRVVVAAPADYAFGRHDWEHGNGGREATKGIRLTTRGRQSEFITALIPKPLKPCTVGAVTLSKALTRTAQDRNRKTTTTWHDVHVRLTWEDGVYRPTYTRVTAPTYDRRNAPTAEVELVEDGDDTTLALKLEYRGRDNKVEKTANYRLALKRAGGRYSGTYSGTLDGNAQSGDVSGEFLAEAYAPVPIYAPFTPPVVQPLDHGIRIGSDEVIFGGGPGQEGGDCVTVRRDGRAVMTVAASDVDLNRSQGDIGLCVPDAGYPFGVIPDWLIRQRTAKPDWYIDMWPPSAWPSTAGPVARK